MQTYQFRLCKLRQDQDKTQEQIAAYPGINQTVYSRSEPGKNAMKPHQIIALCDHYKVSADYVLGLPAGLLCGLSKTRYPPFPIGNAYFSCSGKKSTFSLTFFSRAKVIRPPSAGDCFLWKSTFSYINIDNP